MRETSGADCLWPVGGRRGRYQQWRADASTCSILWYGVGETWMQVLTYSQCSWKGLKRWCSNVTWYHHWPSQHLEDSFEELKGPCNRWGKCDHWQNQKPSSTAEKGCQKPCGSSLCMPQVSSCLHWHWCGPTSDKECPDRSHTAVEHFWELSKKACSLPQSTGGDERSNLGAKGSRKIGKSLKKDCKTQ